MERFRDRPSALPLEGYHSPSSTFTLGVYVNSESCCENASDAAYEEDTDERCDCRLLPGGLWQYSRPGASGECTDVIPVFEEVGNPEKGSNAAEKISGGWVVGAKSWSIMDECDQLSEGWGEGGKSVTATCEAQLKSPRPCCDACPKVNDSGCGVAG